MKPNRMSEWMNDKIFLLFNLTSTNSLNNGNINVKPTADTWALTVFPLYSVLLTCNQGFLHSWAVSLQYVAFLASYVTFYLFFPVDPVIYSLSLRADLAE